MPDFTFEALAKTGAKSTGTLTANSEREAALILDGRGLFPLKIGLARTQASGAGGFFGGRVGGRQIATFYSQLADLLHSGVPLLRSLELLERMLLRCVERETVGLGVTADPARAVGGVPGRRELNVVASPHPNPFAPRPSLLHSFTPSQVQCALIDGERRLLHRFGERGMGMADERDVFGRRTELHRDDRFRDQL